MSNIILAHNYKAEAAVPAFTIVKHGTADGNALPSAGSSDAMFGVSSDIPAAINERFDVIESGVADVRYGGTVTRGQQLTSDASGRAVPAAPGAGVNNRVIGVARVSGVVDDIGSVLLSAGQVQG